MFARPGYPDADPPGRLRDLAKVDYGNRGACRDFPMRARCTKDVRSVSRLEKNDALDRIAERLRKGPEILERRREVVEHRSAASGVDGRPSS